MIDFIKKNRVFVIIMAGLVLFFLALILFTGIGAAQKMNVPVNVGRLILYFALWCVIAVFGVIEVRLFMQIRHWRRVAVEKERARKRRRHVRRVK